MTKTDTAIRRVTALAVLLLGLAAAVVSYQHALGVALDHGQHGFTAHLTPITIDGLVLVGGMVLLHCARALLTAPKLAYFALALGISATLYVNGLYGASYGYVGVAVSAWPAVAFVVATELLMGMIRRSTTMPPATQPEPPISVGIDEATQQPAEPSADATPPASDATAEEPVLDLDDALRAAIRAGWTRRGIAAALSADRNKINVRTRMPGDPTPDEDDDTTDEVAPDTRQLEQMATTITEADPADLVRDPFRTGVFNTAKELVDFAYNGHLPGGTP